MGKMQLYDNKEIEWKECPGCEFVNHSFNISCYRVDIMIAIITYISVLEIAKEI